LNQLTPDVSCGGAEQSQALCFNGEERPGVKIQRHTYFEASMTDTVTSPHPRQGHTAEPTSVTKSVTAGVTKSANERQRRYRQRKSEASPISWPRSPAKMLQLLKEIDPQIVRVAVIYNPQTRPSPSCMCGP
jgi:hypothetical protein